jgi:hypothetical protein
LPSRADTRKNSGFSSGPTALGTAIGQGAEERVDEIAVRAVYLHDVEAGGIGAAGGCGPRLDDAGDVGDRQLDRGGSVAPGRDPGRGYGVPGGKAVLGVLRPQRRPVVHRPVRGRLRARMAELDRRHRAALAHQRRQPTVGGNMVVRPDAGAIVGLAPTCLHGRLLVEDEPRAAYGQPAEMGVMPILRMSIDRKILAHRRCHDAVFEQDTADQERREEEGCGTVPGRSDLICHSACLPSLAPRATATGLRIHAGKTCRQRTGDRVLPSHRDCMQMYIKRRLASKPKFA